MKRIIYIVIPIIATILIGVLIIFNMNQGSLQKTSGFVTHNDTETGISFDYPVGWNRVGQLPNGFMLNSPEEKSILFISYSDSDNSETGGADLIQKVDSLLNPFQNNPDFQIINDVSTKIGNIDARDITFSYVDNGEPLKVRLFVTGKYNGRFNYFTLYSSEAFEKDLPDFEKIVKSIKFK